MTPKARLASIPVCPLWRDALVVAPLPHCNWSPWWITLTARRPASPAAALL